MKNIIGYKCPFSLFNGEVDKGTLFFKLSDTMYEAQSPIKEVRTMKFLPKEIVETWEAVYEDEFKIGDWVYVVHDGANYTSHNLHKKSYRKGEIFKISGFEISDINTKLAFTNQGGVLYIEGYKDYFRKATQEEINSLFNKTLTLSNGKEVVVNKGVIKAENTIISIESLKHLIDFSQKIKINEWEVKWNIQSLDIGCWKDIKLSDIKAIINECEKQIELIK